MRVCVKISYVLIYYLSCSQAPYILHSISIRTLHNSYGTPEFPDCGNQVGADWMENPRWANTEPSMNFRAVMSDTSFYYRNRD